MKAALLKSELKTLAEKGCGDCFAQDCEWPDCSPKAKAIKEELDKLAAPVRAQPYSDSTPTLSVGESSFESWFESYQMDFENSTKQLCRDAYAAGMGDLLVVAAGAQARKPLTDKQIKAEFGKLYPKDLPLIELAENNRDFMVESIGARHHLTAFHLGARAIEAAHGIKEQP